MKKQKKSRWLGMVLVAVFLFSGCGAGTESANFSSAEEYVQAARTALQGQDSYIADFKAEVSMNGTGKMTTKGTVTLVQEPLYMQVDTNMIFSDGKQKYLLYLEKGEDAVNQYMNYNGEWTEMTLDEEAAMEGVQIYNTAENMETLLAAAENCSMQEEKNEVVISAVIPKEKLYAVEEACKFFQMAGMSSLSEVYFKDVGDASVTFALDKKTGAPISYEIDLAQALETVTNTVLAELDGNSGITVKTYHISSSLTQLGGVKAGEVPAEAKSSAINYEREISLLEEN